MKTTLITILLVMFSIQLSAQKHYHYETRIDTMGLSFKIKIWHKPPAIKIPDKTWKDAIAIIKKYDKWKALGGQAGVEYWDKDGLVRESHLVLCTDTSFVEIATTWDSKRGCIIYGDWICYVYHCKGADMFAYTVIKPEGKIRDYIKANSTDACEPPPINENNFKEYGKTVKRTW